MKSAHDSDTPPLMDWPAVVASLPRLDAPLMDGTGLVTLDAPLALLDARPWPASDMASLPVVNLDALDAMLDTPARGACP